jgi:amino acid permease
MSNVEASKSASSPLPLDIIIKYAIDDHFDLKNPKVLYEKGSSQVEIFFQAIVLASSSIGISSLAYPTSMANTGIILWVLVLLIAISVNYISGYVLIYCGKETKSRDFGELTHKLLGKYKIIVDFFCMMTNIGIIISCMLTFNDFMTSIFSQEYFHQTHSRFITSKKSLFWIVFPNLLLIPLLMRKSNRDTNVIALCSVLAIVMLAFFTIYIFFFQNNHIIFAKLELFNVEYSAQCFSLLLFGYMNQQTILDVYSTLKCKRTETVSKVIKTQNIIITFAYITIALFGYLTFYNHKDIKNKNIFAFDLERNFFYMMVNLCVGFSVLFSIVSTFRPTKSLIFKYFEPCAQDSKKKIDLWIMMVLQIGQIAAACLLEIYDMNFLNIIDFVSVFISPTICIYLPVLFYIKISKNYKFIWIVILVMIANTFAISKI